MGNIYRQTIRELEGEIEATQQRIHEIEKAIEILTPLAGPEEDDEEDTPAAPRAKKAKGAKPKPAAGDVSKLDAAILAALKKAGGCMKPGELSAAVKVDGWQFRGAVIALADAGQVKRKGNGRGAVVMLPGYKPAKEAL